MPDPFQGDPFGGGVDPFAERGGVFDDRDLPEEFFSLAERLRRRQLAALSRKCGGDWSALCRECEGSGQVQYERLWDDCDVCNGSGLRIYITTKGEA